MADMMKDLQGKVKSQSEINNYYKNSSRKGQSSPTSPNTPKREIGRQPALKGDKFMSNAQKSKSFKESLKTKPVDHAKAQAAAKANTSSSTPGQKGNQGRSKGGPTR